MSEIREEIEVEYWNNEYSRQAKLMGGAVAVWQSTALLTAKMKPPTVSCPGLNDTVEEIKPYLAALARAVEIAAEWQADTGRDYREVLKG